MPRAITHFPSRSASFDINPNVHMFTEDVHLAVMPIGGRTEKHKEFSVILEGGNADCERVKQVLGSIGRHQWPSVDELVCDVAETIALYLAWGGAAAFEILIEENRATVLHNLTTRRLWRLPGCYLQVVPFSDWKVLKRRFAVIPAAQLWYVNMPGVLGGRFGHKTMLNRLGKCEILGPRFWRSDLERGKPERHFDVREYVRNAHIYCGLLTKHWGWNRRDWSQEWSIEFFTFYKAITFHWAQAVLREHIIAELNLLMVRLQIRCSVNVVGLPTSTEIMRVRNRLEEGTISFGDAFDQVSM